MKFTKKISTIIFYLSLGIIINYCGTEKKNIDTGNQTSGVSIEVLNQNKEVFQGEDLQVKFTNGTNMTISVTLYIYAPSDYENDVTFQNLTDINPKSSKQVDFTTNYWTEFGTNWKVVGVTGTYDDVYEYFDFWQENRDRDEDGISNKIEIKNKDIYDPYYDDWATDPDNYNLPSWVGGPNGNNDWTIAHGQPTIGTLEHGYILPDGNSTNSGGDDNYEPIMIDGNYDGYWYYQGTDDPNTDNWGTLTLLQTVESVGLQWESARKEYDPDRGIITSMDMSLEGGGQWPDTNNDGQPDHSSHQNGRDVDIRYIRNDGTSGAFSFNNQNDYWPEQGINYYDQIATQELVNLFIQQGITIIYVDQRADLIGSGVQTFAGHNNHIHIRIPDPDLEGENN